MGDYFKPWRRKIGVVTLMLACVFMGGWMRSIFFLDFISVTGWIVPGEKSLRVLAEYFAWRRSPEGAVVKAPQQKH